MGSAVLRNGAPAPQPDPGGDWVSVKKFNAAIAALVEEHNAQQATIADLVSSHNALVERSTTLIQRIEELERKQLPT